MAQADNKPTTNPSRFLTAVNRVHLSLLIRDPFVKAAFRAAEDDGLAPEGVDVDHPKTLDGGAAELLTGSTRHVRSLVEA